MYTSGYFNDVGVKLFDVVIEELKSPDDSYSCFLINLEDYWRARPLIDRKNLSTDIRDTIAQIRTVSKIYQTQTPEWLEKFIQKFLQHRRVQLRSTEQFLTEEDWEDASLY